MNNIKKKILLFAPSNGGTTIAPICLNLYKALGQFENVEVKLVSIYKYENGRFDFGQCDYFDKQESGIKLLSFVRKVLWFKKVKKEFNPDICINTLFICSTICVLSGGNDKKIGIFHSPHSQSATKGRFNLFLSYLSYKFIYPKLDKLFCVSKEIYDSIKTDFKNIPSEKLEVVYNIHDLETIKSKTNEELEPEHKEIFQNKVILYCGRLDKNKAPARLLHAFYRALNSLSENIQLVYIGNDNEQIWPEMEKFININNLQNKVKYLGLQTNPYKFIARSEVLVSCSYSEGLPGVLIESLFLKVPVISTNSSMGIWEIFSCNDMYDKNLSENRILSNAIITPNLSHNNIKYEIIDSIQLQKALIYRFENDMKVENFKFLDNVKAENVVAKYLI
jgi:glycosyltransferase involved in cell wall biosynthesis